MIRDLKILALAIGAILIAVTALARSEGIYNPSSNSIGDYQGIDSNAASGVPAYIGPGDIVAGAKSWWGLRCYTLAYSGNVVDVVDASTGTTTGTRLKCSNGVVSGLISGSACTFVTGNTCSPLATTCAVACKAVTLYDQSGLNSCNGSLAPCDLTQATNANRPTYTLNCIGSLPCITFSGSPVVLSSTTPTAAISQIFTISQVSERTGSFTTQMEVINDASCIGTFYANTTNSAAIFANTSVVSAIAFDSTFHAIQSVFNAASSTINVDNSSTSPGNPGSVGISSFLLSMGGGSCGFLTGSIAEGGIWAGGFTSGQQTSMNSNQHAYWGF